MLFFYTQPGYFFHFLRDFCNVCNGIVNGFFSLPRFQYLSQAFLLVCLYFHDNTWLKIFRHFQIFYIGIFKSVTFKC